MIIIYHKGFERNYKKLSSKEKNKLKERLQLFVKDEFNPILNNHALKGKYLGYRSINISGDLRALYKTEGNHIIFVVMGSHSKLYR